jgi:hypothetical protein
MELYPRRGWLSEPSHESILCRGSCQLPNPPDYKSGAARRASPTGLGNRSDYDYEHEYDWRKWDYAFGLRGPDVPTFRLAYHAD